MSEAKQKYWTGDPPARCDLADAVIGKHDIRDTFIDGKTTNGPWANMCLKCARMYGVGVGMGRGQQYERQHDGRWLKVAG
jgi:hypothetical protein